MADKQIVAELTKRFRESRSCDVCGNCPDSEGLTYHGSGCYVVNEDGGGVTSIDNIDSAAIDWMLEIYGAGPTPVVPESV